MRYGLQVQMIGSFLLYILFLLLAMNCVLWLLLRNGILQQFLLMPGKLMMPTIPMIPSIKPHTGHMQPLLPIWKPQQHTNPQEMGIQWVKPLLTPTMASTICLGLPCSGPSATAGPLAPASRSTATAIQSNALCGFPDPNPASCSAKKG
mgnify:CR=1 FL=1